MATKRTAAAAQEDAPEDSPQVEPLAVSTKETDYLGRALVTPGSNSKDFLGRATTATTDHLGRLLLDA
jgi:hypothetical protein